MQALRCDHEAVPEHYAVDVPQVRPRAEGPGGKMRRRKKPVTPKKVIQSAVYKLWLKSRERGEVLRMFGNTCMDCGEKAEQVHHIKPIDMERIIRVLREEVLTTEAMPLCKKCHAEIHARLDILEGMNDEAGQDSSDIARDRERSESI